MSEIRIILTDTGNDNVRAVCSDDTVNAVLLGNASPFVGLTGAQQLALVMAKAAKEYLASLTSTRIKRRLKMRR